MKKTLLALTMLVIGITTTNAQTAEPTKKPKKELSADEKVELKKMRKEAAADLTAEQKEKLKAIKQERKAMTKEEKKATKAEAKAKVDEVLTDAQVAKRKEIKAKRKELRNN